MKQKVTVPSYFEAFSCIAGKCEETCCAGWYIAIDEAAYKKYKKVKQPEMKRRLEKEIVMRKGTVSKDCVAKIKLKNNRCAFLAKDNLCDIYKNLGESYLSETCRVYPRNVNRLGDSLELALALSCPEAARLILLQREKITFREEEDKWQLPVVGGCVKMDAVRVKHFEDALLMIRKQLMAILQDRTLDFMARWWKMEAFFVQLDRYKKQQDVKGLIAFLSRPDIAVKKQEERSDAPEMKALFEALVEMRGQKKWPSARYEGCYEKMTAGLSCGGQEPAFSADSYVAGEKRFLENELKKWTFVFENYFVSYIYERLVPLDKAAPMESLGEMQLYFKLLKLHLVGILRNKESLSEEDLITVIQSFTRVFDHNEQCREQLKKITSTKKAF